VRRGSVVVVLQPIGISSVTKGAFQRAGFVVAPFLGTGTINSNDFSLAGLLVSFAGAVLLLAIVNLFRRGRVR